MEEFAKALCAQSKSAGIPDEYNLFGPVVGEWDLEWIDHLDTEQERHVKGEWIFSWVLEGTAIQDVFIVPSRTERLINPQPDGEYGTTIRIYDPETFSWNVFFGCSTSAIRLNARKEGDEVVITEITEGNMKWIFSDIKENSFQWRKVMRDDTLSWRLVAKAFATRKK